MVVPVDSTATDLVSSPGRYICPFRCPPGDICNRTVFPETVNVSVACSVLLTNGTTGILAFLRIAVPLPVTVTAVSSLSILNGSAVMVRAISQYPSRFVVDDIDRELLEYTEEPDEQVVYTFKVSRSLQVEMLSAVGYSSDFPIGTPSPEIK